MIELSMRIISLSSGSEGNMTYVESENVKVLVDIGLSCNEAVKRLSIIGVKPDQIDVILVTHEHNDHIKGVDAFSYKYDVPVFAHRYVWDNMNLKFLKTPSKNRRFYETDGFKLRDIEVKAIPLQHDVPCFGYVFENNGSKVSILTDIGHTNERILDCIRGSQLVYLEANYDKDMLANGTKYPPALKRRISGGHGHISNDEAALVIRALVPTGTRQIVLSHLSKENNTPMLAYTYISDRLKEFGIIEGVHVKIDVATTEIGTMFKL